MNNPNQICRDLSPPARPTMVVIGLGHSWMGDDGIGPRLIAELSERYREHGVEWMDLGTAGFDVLHAMEGRQKAVIIDCALMGEEPGTIRFFTPGQAASRKIITGGSQHEGDLLRTLSLAHELDACPPEVLIFGIEPEKTAPGLDLSATLEERLESYVEHIARALNLHA